jgi:beta-1,4-N-acetylglucosaminyltransferase
MRMTSRAVATPSCAANGPGVESRGPMSTCTRAPSVLLLCFGEGGHHAQARRLMAHLQSSTGGVSLRVVSITDRAGIALKDTSEFVLAPLRGKHGGALRAVADLVRAMSQNCRRLVQLTRAIGPTDRIVLVSLGPSFAVLPALAVRARGGQVVHIETWSRFSTRSVTGRLMYLVAHHFLVQNEDLLALYPRATYCGRL